MDCTSLTTQLSDIPERIEAITEWEKEFAGHVNDIKQKPWILGDMLNRQDAPHGTKYDIAKKYDIPRRTAEHWAFVAGVYKPTMRMVELSFNHHQIASSLPVEQRAELLQWAADNKKSTREFREVVNAKRLENTSKETPLPEGKYRVIYADPPWQYGNQGTRAATNNHYDTMPIHAIADLPVSTLAMDKALLFIWTTNGFLQDTLNSVIPSWGFEFKSAMVWVKPQMGIGNYVRNAHEYLLIANRGGLTTESTSQISWICEERTKHSKKPSVFRHVVENMAEGPRIELFARESHEGWDCWGNEVQTTLLPSGNRIGDEWTK